jgi:hypothetical protein
VKSPRKTNRLGKLLKEIEQLNEELKEESRKEERREEMLPECNEAIEEVSKKKKGSGGVKLRDSPDVD